MNYLIKSSKKSALISVACIRVPDFGTAFYLFAVELLQAVVIANLPCRQAGGVKQSVNNCVFRGLSVEKKVSVQPLFLRWNG